MKKMILFVILLVHSFSLGKNNGDSLTHFSNYFILQHVDSLDGNEYFQLVDSLKAERKISYFRLRMAYTKTSYYNPYSTKESDVYKRVEELFLNRNINEAIKILYNLLDSNYVSIKAHMYCSFLYAEKGDSVRSNYHSNIYNKLLESILDSGDGKGYESAYWVISTKEEYDLINVFRLSFNEQNLIENDGHSFDLLKVQDEETHENIEIYFNIDLLQRHLSKMFK